MKIIGTTPFGLGVISPQVDRAPGLHVSHIIRDIDQRLRDGGDRPLDGHLTGEEARRVGNYWAHGFMWERVVEYTLSEMLGEVRPGVIRQEPVLYDGVWMSPDAMWIKPWILEEYKWTFRSSRRLDNFESDFFSWLMQIQAYCLAMDTQRCDLYVAFACGDYRSSGPQAFRISLHFSKRDLLENWEMLKKHQRDVMKVKDAVAA